MRLKCARPAALTGAWKGDVCPPAPALPPAEPDPLRDPHRIAAARRLLVEVPGPAAFDRLSALAARMRRRRPRQGHAVHRPGHRRRRLRPAAGRHRRPRAADRSALGDRRPPGGPAQRPRRASGGAGRRPAGGDVGPGAGLPRLAARRGVRARRRRAGRLRPGAAEVDRRRDASCSGSWPPPSSPSWSSPPPGPRSARRLTRLNVALEASSIGTWERDLRTGVIDWDERCAALFGLDGRHPVRGPSSHGAAVRAPGRRRGRCRRPCSGRWRSAASSRPSSARLTVDGERALDGRPGPRWSPIRAASRCGCWARSSTSPTPARQADAAAVGHAAGDGDRRGGRRAGQRRADARTCPRSCSAARRCSARESSALAVFDPDDGPLRLHMTNRLTDEVQVHVDVPRRRRRDRAGRRPADPVRRDARPSGCCWPTARRPSPGSRPCGGPGGARTSTRWPRCRCAWRGGILGAFVPLWSTEHPFAADDVEVLEALAAQIALSVSRLQADAERAVGRRRDGRGEPAAAAARRGGADPVGDPGDRPAGPRAGRARRARPRPTGAGSSCADEQGRLHEHGLGPPRPCPAGGGRGLRALDGRRDDRRGRGAGGHRHGAADGHARRSTGTGWGGRCPIPAAREALARLGVGSGDRRPPGGARADPGRPRSVQPGGPRPAQPRPRSTPRSRSACGPDWRCTTRGSSASSGTSPTRCSAACSPTRRSRTTRRSSSATCRRRPGPRSAATGTTPSCSPTARRCSRSATSSATTPGPPRRWARCAACCAASATPAADRPPRC